MIDRKKRRQKQQAGFSLIEILVALILGAMILMIALRWLNLMQKNHRLTELRAQMEQALFYQLEAYPEKLSLTDLGFSQSQQQNLIDRFEINAQSAYLNCQQVTVAIEIKNAFVKQTQTRFEQKRLFCD